ncbi:MAG: MBL fold metallo-hydrolase [Chloroflexota bacterium]
MKIRFLGAHSTESPTARYVSIFVNDRVILDAGAVGTALSLREQEKIEAILLTHQHYDHIRDIPTIARNLYHQGISLNVWTTPEVRAAIEAHLLNGEVYPRFQDLPADKPTVSFNDVILREGQRVDGHQVIAAPVNHCTLTVGYQVTDGAGNSMFYTADTGPGLEDCWNYVTPQLLIADVTMPNRYEAFSRQTQHLTPALLQKEMETFRRRKGYLPQIVVVHMDADLEGEIREDLKAVSETLATTITLASEGMEINIAA